MNDRSGAAGLRRRFRIEWAWVAALASTILIAAALGQWTRPADNLLYDAAMRIAPAAADPEILIIAIDEPSLEALGRWPWPRSLHAGLMERLADARPAAVTLDLLLAEPAADDAALAAAMLRLPSPARLPAQFLVPGRNGTPYERLDPAPVLVEAAKVRHANTLIDGDGTVRSAAMCFAPARNVRPLPHMMWFKDLPGFVGECRDPLRLRFAAPESFATVSFASVLRGEVPGALLEGRRVLIGMTAQGLGDRYAVPTSDGSNMPGVEINANIANAQLRNAWVREPPMAGRLLYALAPAWILLIAFWRIRPRSINLLVLALVAVVLSVSITALAFNLWIAPGPALLGLVLVYPLWGWRRLQATSDYMASELAALEREEALPLGGAGPADTDHVTRQAGQLAGAIDQLRDLKRFVGDTLAGLPDPALVSDMAGRIVLTNAAADTAFGSALAGQDTAALLASIALPIATTSLADYLGSPAHRHIEFETRDRRSFVLRRAAIISADGSLRGHIDYLTDITEIAEARTERERMLQLLSHDMRAPQAAILALVGQQGGEIDRTRIARHARQTLTLADNFVDLARMQERPFEPEPVIASDLASEAADSLWPVAQQRGVQVTVTDESDCAFVAAERESLFRACVNLIDNAVKYSPDRGQVTVHVDIAGGIVRIAVRDEGKGIDSAILPYLFQRFASERAGTAVKGVGLGLNYVAAVAARHQGTIEAVNQPSGGAQFILSVPLDE